MHSWVVLKNNIKIYIKAAPTCFGAVAPSSGSALIRAGINALPDYGVTVTPKHVGAVLMYILILFFLRQLTRASVGE